MPPLRPLSLAYTAAAKGVRCSFTHCSYRLAVRPLRGERPCSRRTRWALLQAAWEGEPGRCGGIPTLTSPSRCRVRSPGRGWFWLPGGRPRLAEPQNHTEEQTRAPGRARREHLLQHTKSFSVPAHLRPVLFKL